METLNSSTGSNPAELSDSSTSFVVVRLEFRCLKIVCKTLLVLVGVWTVAKLQAGRFIFILLFLWGAGAGAATLGRLKLPHGFQ